MNANKTKFVAVTKSVGGTELFFTALRWDLETSPYACHAKAYDTAQAALDAVKGKADKYTAREFVELPELERKADETRRLLAGEWSLIPGCKDVEGYVRK